MPVFAALSSAFPGTSPVNKTILTVTPDELVDDVLTVIDDVCGTFEESGTGLVFVLPIDLVRGLGTGLN